MSFWSFGSCESVDYVPVSLGYCDRQSSGPETWAFPLEWAASHVIRDFADVIKITNQS